MGNDLRNLYQGLLPAGSYFKKKRMLQRHHLSIDEGHLHSLLSGWDGKDSLDKLMIVASAMASKPSVAFSVRFGTSREKSLAADPTQALRKIRNELSSLTALGPTMMTMELDQGGRLHLHGAVSTDAAHKTVKAILRKLGGKTDNVAFRNCFQVVIKPATSMCCWAAYMTKDLINMPAEERDSFIYMSQSATRLGREQLPKLKSLVTQKLGITAEWRGKSGVYNSSGIQVMSTSVTDMTRH